MDLDANKQINVTKNLIYGETDDVGEIISEQIH